MLSAGEVAVNGALKPGRTAHRKNRAEVERATREDLALALTQLEAIAARLESAAKALSALPSVRAIEARREAGEEHVSVPAWWLAGTCEEIVRDLREEHIRLLRQDLALTDSQCAENDRQAAISEQVLAEEKPSAKQEATAAAASAVEEAASKISPCVKSYRAAVAAMADETPRSPHLDEITTSVAEMVAGYRDIINSLLGAL